MAPLHHADASDGKQHATINDGSNQTPIVAQDSRRVG
jgi:hypothetical protein